jgi:hypothetical protein
LSPEVRVAVTLLALLLSEEVDLAAFASLNLETEMDAAEVVRSFVGALLRVPGRASK